MDSNTACIDCFSSCFTRWKSIVKQTWLHGVHLLQYTWTFFFVRKINPNTNAFDWTDSLRMWIHRRAYDILGRLQNNQIHKYSKNTAVWINNKKYLLLMTTKSWDNTVTVILIQSKQISACSGDGRPAPRHTSNHLQPDCNMQNNKSYNTTIQRATLTITPSVCSWMQWTLPDVLVDMDPNRLQMAWRGSSIGGFFWAWDYCGALQQPQSTFALSASSVCFFSFFFPPFSARFFSARLFSH